MKILFVINILFIFCITFTNKIEGKTNNLILPCPDAFSNLMDSVDSDTGKMNLWQKFEVENPPECLNLEAVASGITYPDSAKDNGIEGEVLVKILVDEKGGVHKIGSMRGPEIFFDAVKKASWGLLFTPGLQHGKPVKVWVTVPFNFKIKKE